MNYVVTLFAIAGLFVVPTRPAIAFFIWSGTNLYWLIYAYRVNDRPQMIMFAAFTISSVIQFFRF